MGSFQRLVRFENALRETFFGEAESGDKLTVEKLVNSTLRVYNGNDPWDAEFSLTEKHEVVHRVRDPSICGMKRADVGDSLQILSPIAATPIFQCVGLNYRAHAAESNVSFCRSPLVYLMILNDVPG